MLRLLLAVLIIGVAAALLLPNEHHRAQPVAATVKPMLQTLRRNGCGTVAAGAASISTDPLAGLKSAIENCQQRAAQRAAANTR